MKGRTRKPEPAAVPQGVRRGEVLPLQTLMARLGVGRRQVWAWERAGLQGVTAGHRRFYLGDAVVDFFAGLAEQQNKEGNADGN